MSLNKYCCVCLSICLVILLSAAAFYFPADSGISREKDSSLQSGAEEFVAGEEGLIFYSLIYRGIDGGLLNTREKTMRPEPMPGLAISMPSEDSQPPHPAKTASAVSSGGSGVSLSRSEQQMVSMINQSRSSAGLPPLQVCGRTTTAARAKSRDMAQNNYFSHTSPTYGRFTRLLDNYGVSYRTAAENIAWNTSGSASTAHNSFMNSPGHRSNILGGNFNYVGVGVYSSGGRHYYTQLFVGR